MSDYDWSRELTTCSDMLYVLQRFEVLNSWTPAWDLYFFLKFDILGVPNDTNKLNPPI